MKSRGLETRLTQYGDAEFSKFMRRAFASSMGYGAEAVDRPIVGIVNTASDLNNCHSGLIDLIPAVKRGVLLEGGLPVAFPTISLGEAFLSPTSMLFRNLMSMDVEEMIRAQPIDAVVLVGGCDKTLPALLMGAASAGVPAIVVVAGPMLTGSHKGERIGACTDCRRFWASYRRGEYSRSEMDEIEGQLVVTTGTCAVMGTASTMACLAEAMGMMLPGGATIPAVFAERLRHGEASGRKATRLASRGPTPAQVMTPAAFGNALRVLQAIGGSTNAVIHLAAIAGRLGFELGLDQLDAVSEETPVLVDLKPTGNGYMEDFHRAGGMPVLLRELGDLVDRSTLTVTGQTLGELLEERAKLPEWQKIIRPTCDPFQARGALIALRGNLAPDGALLKRSAASSELLHKRARAVVFTSLEDLARRIDDPDLDVTPDDIMVLQNAGLVGAPGMPEAGYFPLPSKLRGVTDMVRISDARMSGTSFGTVVLHISPEAAVGGPLGLVRDGDTIELDANARRLSLLVSEEELVKRRTAKSDLPELPKRGYARLFAQTIQQPHLGADFHFLRHESLQSEPEQGKLG
jgi:dihydroxy-acid dehydratase